MFLRGPSNGYGKSLCYACLPLLFDHLYQLEDSQRSIVIVVTPLTAIMEDLVTIKSAFLALGSPTESEQKLLLLLGILERYRLHSLYNSALWNPSWISQILYKLKNHPGHFSGG